MSENYSKKFLRDDFKHIRNSLSIEKKHIMDVKICNRILKIEEYKKADIILGYKFNMLETNIDKLLLYALSHGKRIALPKIMSSGEMMNYYFINNFNELKIGRYSIMEPDVECKLVSDSDLGNNNVIMFVPGLGYNLNGYRIGYGKGYYDKYICSKYNGLKIGICYQCCIIEQFEVEAHDINVDILVSDERLYMIGERI